MRTATPLTTWEKVILALLMTWAAGFVDIVGYLALYGLYTAHMTGETVAMARHLSRVQWYGVVRRGWPILAFVFGLLLGAFIFDAEKRRAIKVPFPATVGAESVLIGAFVVVGSTNGPKVQIPPQPAAMFFLMVALLATAMGIQNVAIRRVGAKNVAPPPFSAARRADAGTMVCVPRGRFIRNHRDRRLGVAEHARPAISDDCHCPLRSGASVSPARAGRMVTPQRCR